MCAGFSNVFNLGTQSRGTLTVMDSRKPVVLVVPLHRMAPDASRTVIDFGLNGKVKFSATWSTSSASVVGAARQVASIAERTSAQIRKLVNFIFACF